jgi:hypothetical protein
MKYFNHDVSDKFGYYQVGNLKLHGKYDAISIMSKTGKHLTYHYHDEVYSSYDWRKEPQPSLLELYKKRAEQLRQKYDHVVVCYSGGADSHTVLNAFVDNDIHVDEILCYYGGVSAQDGWFNAEVSQVAIPYAKKVIEKFPSTTLRLYDVQAHMAEFWSKGDPNDWDTVAHKYGTGNHALGTVLPSMVASDQHYLNILNQGKTVCFVVGYDKPRVWQVDGRYCHRFLDIPSQFIIIGSDVPVESFFWSADLPELLIKQCHVVKRYLEHATPTSNFISKNNTGFACKDYNGSTLWLTNHGVHDLIYPTWDVDTFTVGKDPYTVFGKRDEWFWREKNFIPYQNWHKRMSYAWSKLPDYWKNEPGNIFKGAKLSWTIPYFLE